MGMFKDLKKITQQAKEMDKTFDPGAQARAATEQMKQLNQQMASASAALTAPPEDAIDATAQVLSVGAASGMMNMNPILPIELLVTMPGGAPMPVSTSVIVPTGQIPQLSAGAQIKVKVSKANPSSLAIDWS
jgi:hypothetical protein